MQHKKLRRSSGSSLWLARAAGVVSLASATLLAGEAYAGAFTVRTFAGSGPATAQPETEDDPSSRGAAAPVAAPAATGAAAPAAGAPADPAAAAPAPAAADPNAAAAAGTGTVTASQPTVPNPGDPATGTAPAPAPTVEPAPDAATPEPDTVEPDYASSKDAGTALSGGEVDDRTSTTESVGNIKEVKEKKGLSHHKTGIIGVGFTYGVSLITAGDKFCGEFSDSRQDPDSRKPLCVGATPPAIDLMAGFGASDRLDVIVGVRINLMARDFDTKDCTGDTVCADGKGLFNQKLAIGVMPGIRIYGKETNRIVKFGGQVQVMYQFEDFEGYRTRPDGPDEDADPDNREDEGGVGNHFVGMRGGPVLQIDPHHNFGITLMPAMIPGFRPKAKSEVDAGWFEIGFEATLGLEARFP